MNISVKSSAIRSSDAEFEMECGREHNATKVTEVGIDRNSTKHNVLFIDDHSLLREILSDYLKSGGVYNVDQASTVKEAQEFIRNAEEPYHVVLLDYSLPDSLGLTTLEKLVEMSPESKFAIITGSGGAGVGLSEFARKALASGATGFLTKDISPDALLQGIEAIRLGVPYIPVEIMYPKKEEPNQKFKITGREYDVLCMVAKGLQNKQIAYDLSLSEATIKMHVKSLFSKIGANNRTELSQLAKTASLI